MASITFTVTIGANTRNAVFNLSDADAQKLITVGAIAWPPKDADGNVIASPTNAQVLQEWARAMMRYTKRDVKRIESLPSVVNEIVTSEA